MVLGLNLGFQIIQQGIQTKKSTVDINKMFGSAITVHLSQLLVGGQGFTQAIDFCSKGRISKIEFLTGKGQGEHLD